MKEKEIYDMQQISWPADWATLFGRERPLWIEIGFGNGQFLLDIAKANPEINFVGIEISHVSLKKGLQRVKTAGLKNVLILQASGESALWLLCQEEEVDRVFINFPDPWHKSGHTHRRLLNERFLHLLATRMKAGCALEIAMDHPDYIEVTTELLLQTPYFKSQKDEPFALEDPGRKPTKYELKAAREGRVSYYYKWVRNKQPAENIFKIPEELPMPHLVVYHPMSLDEIGKQFAPFAASHEEMHIRCTDMYRSMGHESLMVETFITETPINQRIGISIRQREQNRLIISLHEVGFPRSSIGVRWAIHDIGNWLLGLTAEARIEKSNLFSSS